MLEGAPAGGEGHHPVYRRAALHRGRRRRGRRERSSMLKPALARGELQVVGATTLDEYRKHVEKDPALERRFQPVLVDEPTVDETISILFGLRDRYEAHHRVKISEEGIIAAAQLGDRHNGQVPADKAIDLLDEAAAEGGGAARAARRRQRIEEEIASLEREKEDAVRPKTTRRPQASSSVSSSSRPSSTSNTRAGPDAARPTPQR